MNDSYDNEQNTATARCVNQVALKMDKEKSDYDHVALIALMCFVCHGGVQTEDQRSLLSHTTVPQ